MALEFIGTILGGFVLFFEFVSALIIIYGGLKAVSKILLAGIFKKPQDYKIVRKEFTDNILFGLELLIIADLVETLRKPFLQELLLVGGIVVIRTVLSYFLSKEVEEGSLTVSKDKLEG